MWTLSINLVMVDNGQWTLDTGLVMEMCTLDPDLVMVDSGH